MQKKEIKIDFDKKCGKIKPLHCFNGGPRSLGFNSPFDFTDEFIEMGVPMVRTCSAAGEYGNNQFINIHCIFPDFSADEQLEESYNFLPTDLYVSSIRSSGADIMFCLGESREPYSKKLYTRPPDDMEKWARICEHIIMHYNEGWANGFKLNIKCWEIWASPDSPECWTGEREEYFELYRITANHLRERFPKIKIGAYGAGGFYSLNRLGATDEMKSYVPFMQQFFTYVTNKERPAPLDFFTWCCYTSSPEEIVMHSKYARNYLDLAGLRRTKSIICEYNTQRREGVVAAQRETTPSELCASLIMAQQSYADMMMYSTSNPSSVENTLFSVDDFVNHHHYASYTVMCHFGKLYRLGTAVDSGDNHRKELYKLCATNGKEAALLLTTREFEGKMELLLLNCPYTHCTLSKTVPGGTRGMGRSYRSGEIDVSSGKLAVTVGKGEIYYVSFFNK